MKRILKSAVLTTLLLVATIGNAQSEKTEKSSEKIENSLLWEISGNGLEKSSYLYGTVHMMCEKDFLMTEKVKTAFEKSEKLALEIDFDDPVELQNMQKMATASEPLSKTLTKEEYQKLDEFLKVNLGVGAAQFENANMVAIMSTVMMKALNCNPKMYEFEFIKMAMQKKIEIAGLEKVQDQITSFEKSFTNKEFIDQLQYYDVNYFIELTKIYNEEKLKDLFAIVTDEKFMDENAKNWMLDYRNKNWIAVMPELMKKESVFFAVGAGHLPGDNGVINLLRQAGYTVKSIEK